MAFVRQPISEKKQNQPKTKQNKTKNTLYFWQGVNYMQSSLQFDNCMQN